MLCVRFTLVGKLRVLFVVRLSARLLLQRLLLLLQLQRQLNLPHRLLLRYHNREDLWLDRPPMMPQEGSSVHAAGCPGP